ncbi:MAG: MFS transporter [Acidibrevibacterium sp.]|uniref:MFS transporter n=1 Tax=Acidibrevibacterium sp. TaxID=2606776 RepID=UPI003CFDACB7
MRPPRRRGEAGVSGGRAPAIGFALALLAIDALGIGLVIPIVPQLVLELSGGDASHAAAWVGLLATSFSTMQFLFSPIIGGLSDRFGRRPVMLLSVLGLGVGYLILAAAPSLGFVLLARLIAGVTTANISAVTAYISDVTPPERRGQRFGLVGAMFGLGFVLGPVIGGVLGGIWLRLPFLAGGGLSLCNALYGFFMLPESLAQERRRNFSWRRANPIAALANLRANPRARRLAMAWSATWFGLGALQSAFVLSTGLRFGWHTTQNGFALALAGLSQALVQSFLMRRILGRFGETRTALLGCLAAALAQSTYAFATAGWMIYAGVVISALGAINTPAIRALFAAEAGADRQGEAQGVLASLQSLTAIFAPLLGAALFAHFTAPGAAIFFPGAPFLLAAFAYLLAGALLAGLVYGARM